MNSTTPVPGQNDPATLMSAAKPNSAPTPDANSPSALMSKPQTTEPTISQKLTPPASPADLMTLQRVAHDSAIGNFFRSIATGETTSYDVDPQTGQMVEHTVKERPGQLFRSIVAGALVGGLAGSRSNGGFVGGIAAGGSAEMQRQQQQDLLKRQEAEQNFATQQKAQAQKDQEIETAAKIASLNATNLRSDLDLDLHSQEFLSQSNEQNNTIAIKLTQAGAHVATIPFNGQNINGVQGNGPRLRTMLKQVALGTPGTSRVWTHSVDYSGLHFGGDGRWLDKNGQPVDLAARTTWTAFDLPSKQAAQNVKVSGKSLRKLGFSDVDPNSDYSLKLSDWLSLQASVLKQRQSSSELGIRERLINQRATQARTLKDLEEQRTHLESLAAYAGTDPTAVKNAQDAKAKIPEIQAQIDKVLGITTNQSPAPPPNSAPKLAPGQIPAGAHVAENAKGERVYSVDGKTWFDAQTHQRLQ